MAKSTAAIEIEVTPKGDATVTVKSFKKQLLDARIEAEKIVQSFGDLSPEALAAQQKIAGINDEIQKFNNTLQGVSANNFQRIGIIATGLTRGFEAAQGALALFGSESEDLQKTLVKVQSAMALADGLEGIKNIKDQLTGVATTISQSVVKAFSTLKGAIAATGIGALAVGLGLLITYWDDIVESLSGVSSEQKKVNAATRDAVAAQQGQIQKLQSYQKLVSDTTLSEKERKNALNELNKLGVETRDININSAKSLQILNDRIQDNIVLIQQKAKAQALEKIIAEESEKIYREQNKTVDEQVGFLDKLYAADMALMTADYEGAKASRAKQKANETINKSQKLLNVATNEYSKILEGLNKTETKTKEVTVEVNDAYEKQSTTLQNKLNLQLTALDKAKAKELSNLNLTEKEKIEIENKYAELSLNAKKTAIEKEQKITGLITDPKQRLAQQRKLNEDLAKLDVDRINQKTSFEEKLKILADKEYQQNLANKNSYLSLLNEQFSTEANQRITYIKERDKYVKDRRKTEIEIAQIELDELQKKYDASARLGETDLKLAQEISDKKTQIRNTELALEQEKAEKEKEIQSAKYQAVNDSLNTISELYTAFASQNEKDQKKAFEVNKAAQIAQAIVNTYQGVTAALSSVPLFPGQQFVNAGLALAAGLAAVKRISDTKFQSKNAQGGGIPTQSSGAGMQQMAAPRVSGLPTNEALTQERRVYVTEGDISRTQKRVSNNQSVSVVE